MNSYFSVAPRKQNIFIVWLIVLCSLRFFTLFVPETAGKAMVLFSVFLILGIWTIFTVYGITQPIKFHFRIEILMFFLSFVVSAFAGVFFHNQPIWITLSAQYTFYLFLFYFLVHRLKPHPDVLIRMILWLGYIYSAIYFIQYILYPFEIVTSPMLKDRGTIRIIMPGAEYMVAAWFILISRFLKTSNIKNLFGLLPFIVIVILLGTRQLIAAIGLVTIINILFSRSLKSKALVMVAVVIAIIPFYFLFQDIFINMAALSAKKQSSLQGNIRVFAANYFLFEMNHNPLWIITGNGFPGPHSDYGKFLIRISHQLGYYQSDVGLIGDFSKFGILYLFAEISILLKMVFFRIDRDYSFIRYTAIIMLLTLFTGAGLGAAIIIQLCILMYIIDFSKQSNNT